MHGVRAPPYPHQPPLGILQCSCAGSRFACSQSNDRALRSVLSATNDVQHRDRGFWITRCDYCGAVGSDLLQYTAIMLSVSSSRAPYWTHLLETPSLMDMTPDITRAQKL